MKKDRLILGLTQLAWGLLIFNLGLIFIVPADTNFGSVALLLAYSCVLFLTLFVAVTWLMIVYRRFFRSWMGWTVPLILLVVSNLTTSNVWRIDQPNIALLFSIVAVASIWMVGLATAILLWYRDVGLGLIGWAIVAMVWVLTLAWRFQGNLVELWLFSLNHPEFTNPLWWINPLICFMWWVIPLGIISFAGHTIRILVKELS